MIQFFAVTDPIHVVNEVSGLLYTVIGLIVLVMTGIIATVKLFLAVKQQGDAMEKHLAMEEKWKEKRDEERETFIKHFDEQIITTNNRITDQLRECGKHRDTTTTTITLVRDFKREMTGQVIRLHSRIDMMVSNQHDLMVGMARGDFRAALENVEKRRVEFDKSDRDYQHKLIDERYKIHKEDEENGNG